MAVASDPVSSLRERRHRETKQLLVEVAFDLFVEEGFANVSMEEVAQAAGVSRSTLYRRFPTKEAVVLEVPRRWLAAFDDAFGALPPDASLRDAVNGTTLAVAAHIDRHQDVVRTAYEILGRSPSLQQSGLATTAWLRRIVEVFERFSAADAEASLVSAGAYLGAIDAMMLHWAATGGTSSVTDSTTRLLSRLEPILPPDRTR